jgi:site-specific DNA-methyltransferase (adenine-specific)
MKPYAKNKHYTLYLGDALKVLSTLEENSIDAVITDPPYEIGFMNKGWDNTGVVFDVKTWEQVIRVLKPGGHILAFNHSRTFHRMAVAIEDAGFQVRDTIMWVYGTGFPKSMNIKEAIDKKLPDKADKWEGWGTGLKPSYEPILLARKPMATTITDNVIIHGVGGLNIDECRIGEEVRTQFSGKHTNGDVYNDFPQDKAHWETVTGRYPANLIHDGSDEAMSIFPTTSKESASRFFYTPKASKKDRDEGLLGFEKQTKAENLLQRKEGSDGATWNGKYETGNAYAGAGAPKRNIHPTVKPTDLMQYLIRLIAPKGATVLDLFMGSGSTGKAAMIENVERNANYYFIGIDFTEEYLPIAKARIDYEILEKEEKEDIQLSLFDL